MKNVIEKIILLNPKFGIKIDNLMCITTKNRAYVFPVEHITSNYHPNKRRVLYHVTTKFTRVKVDELPGQTIDIQLPELHSKKMKIFFGLTSTGIVDNVCYTFDNCTKFVSKKVW
jgi:hypothetical protein